MNLRGFLNLSEDLEWAMSHSDADFAELKALFTSALMKENIQGRENLSFDFVKSFYKQKMEEELEETRRFIDSFNVTLSGTTERPRYLKLMVALNYYKKTLDTLGKFLNAVNDDFNLNENDTYKQLLDRKAQAPPAPPASQAAPVPPSNLVQCKLRF